MTENRVVVYYMKDASFLYLLIKPITRLRNATFCFYFLFCVFLFFDFSPCALKSSAFARPTVGGGVGRFPKRVKVPESKRRDALVLFF